jgi:formate-dependent nitrite reductase membrane component NrfD
MNATLRVGLIGLSITLVLNVFGFLVLRQAAARFLSDDWWSVWFPSFIVWFGIAITGLLRRSSRSREGQDPKRS